MHAFQSLKSKIFKIVHEVLSFCYAYDAADDIRRIFQTSSFRALF